MTEIQSTAQNIKAKILQAKNILLATHQNPDSDALGALGAFSKYLEKIGKNHLLFSVDKPLAQFSFLVNAKRLKNETAEIKKDKFDLIITLDSSDLDHAGIREIVKSDLFLINIDHHPTNLYFGQINLVMPEAVSTTEILYHFFNQINYPLEPGVASCLLAGILGDTNNFTNHNTTDNSLKVAAKLLSAGAEPSFINESFLNKKTMLEINLWGTILKRLSKSEEFDVASTIVAQTDLENFTDQQKATDGLTNFLNNLAGVKVVMVLKETANQEIKVSLRTNDELINLTEFVKIFNGGGHKKAAGFTIAGKLVETERGWQVV